MSYFYEYFAREYREGRKDRLLPGPAAIFREIAPEDIRSCRKTLKNAFAGYREGRNAEELKRLLGEYREYIAGCHGANSRDRYNAVVYRYMIPAHVGTRAIGSRLGVGSETVFNYINRGMDEMLLLCMGVPAADPPEDEKEAVCMLVDHSRIFFGMAGDYIFRLFPERRERAAVEQGRQITERIMENLADAAGAYTAYCNDEHTRIEHDIRKAKVLEKRLSGIPPAAIAGECGCCVSTVYKDIEENGRRLAAMLFDPGDPRGGRSETRPAI